MSPNLTPGMPLSPAPGAAPVLQNIAPNAVSAGPAMPNVLSGTPDLMQAAGSKVNMIGSAIQNTATGLWPVLGGVAMLGLTFLGLKAIVLGKNPLKS